MANQFFLTKSHAVLLEELRGENRLHRVLGPVQLSALGVGAIIGTGIFVLTGVAAHDRTGPALMLSFVVAGITCVFAALCYAEFASMVPVAGAAPPPPPAALCPPLSPLPRSHPTPPHPAAPPPPPPAHR